jgi:hypothetical protein
MLFAAPKFPALNDWRRMSEGEQDALIGKMEATKRRKTLLRWGTVVLLCIVAAIAVGAMF